MSESDLINFDKLTPKQIDVLGQISICNDVGHPRKTLESLLAKGLIEEYKEEARDRLGVFSIKRYFMPIWVHIQWCEWCSKNYKEEDEK